MVEGQLHDILVVSRRFEDKRMNLYTQEIRKNPEGLAFDQELDLLKELQKRNPEILDLKDVTATGRVAYDTGLYVLDYQLTYTIVLASSRSMEPVELQESYPVTEVFAEDAQSEADIEAFEEDLILPIEGGKIDLSESVEDNILLNIPLKVLTPDEESGHGFIEGNDWKIMTEEEYQEAQALKKEENSPFAGLQGLFDEE